MLDRKRFLQIMIQNVLTRINELLLLKLDCDEMPDETKLSADRYEIRVIKA